MPLSPSWSDTMAPGFYSVTDDQGRNVGSLAFTGPPLDTTYPVYLGERIERFDTIRVEQCSGGTVLLDSDGDAVQRYYDGSDKWAITWGDGTINSREVCLPATVIYVG